MHSRSICCRSAAALIATLILVLTARNLPAQGAPSGAKPTEDAYGTQYMYRATGLVTDDNRRVESAEFDSVLAVRASRWIAARQNSPVRGFQLDAMGALYIAAGDDARARAEFDTRLRDAKLSADDRAFTLALAARLFSAPSNSPGRMAVALGYLAQLDALPIEVGTVQYRSHVAMAIRFYILGDAKQALQHFEAAFAKMSHLPYWDRARGLFSPVTFELAADVLSGQPNGRARIDSLAAYLKDQLTAPPNLVARDHRYAYMGAEALRGLADALTLTNYLGRPAVPVTAHYWWNVAAPATRSVADTGAVEKSMADGRIRLLEFGDFNCMYCMRSLREMNVIYPSMPPEVEFLFVTVNLGYWGTKHVTGAREAQYLKDYYLTQRHYTVPTALWTGAERPDPDGGWLVASSPTWDAYAISRGPQFLVIDGHGIVRHLSMGYTKGLKPQMRAVQYLLAEAKQRNSAARASRAQGAAQ